MHWLQIVRKDVPHGCHGFPVSYAIEFIDKSSTIEGSMVYRTDIYDKKTVYSFLEYFQETISDIIISPEKKLYDYFGDQKQKPQFPHLFLSLTTANTSAPHHLHQLVIFFYQKNKTLNSQAHTTVTIGAKLTIGAPLGLLLKAKTFISGPCFSSRHGPQKVTASFFRFFFS